MDVPSTAWLSELDMQGCDFKNQHQMTDPSIDTMGTFSSECLTDNNPYFYPRNQSFEAANISDSRIPDPFAPNRVSSSNTFIMSFEASKPEMKPHHLYDGSNLQYSSLKEERLTNRFPGSVEGAKRVPGTSRNLTQAQDHVLSERKRREILNRRFISLSALLPNLKKMDKASVLECATKYLKQLQTRKKELEEEKKAKSKQIIQESAVSIRRSKICDRSNDDMPSSTSSEGTNSSPTGETSNPEIEVRVSESSVLVRIYSQKNSSVVMKTLSEMERLHLIISSSSVIPFSNSYLLITISAEMTGVLTAMDIVKYLRSSIGSFL